MDLEIFVLSVNCAEGMKKVIGVFTSEEEMKGHAEEVRKAGDVFTYDMFKREIDRVCGGGF